MKASTRATFVNGVENINNFKVWGNHDGTTAFNGTEVTKQGSDWVYEPLQHWNMGANQYEFTAYTPIEAGTPAIDNNHLLSVSGINSINQVE